ncbi:hypothetical protein BKK79_08430 [Cupriavidus sp. USMAA2-4]|uniref:HTH marR-type domain-containing protein n=1 Tax=Cupriavidus malaysiensis TaxID=367825 RepID=A0ABN4TI63_9BURK|nr:MULTISPECIES: MarR family winged helix-turn-helix transcriptional regulator [Cupriavidus]AOY91824.1 hypothetical protein BKK79_08430 [Cupriavidus sp. USMAA2-4]AOY98617.1 hypothetical protein BKK81_04490 [Cupriavidus sp. USMAHM13]AOZ05048.1 hypothetical protein BKK80_03835 [Cupriavidus malaysiensis]
MSRTTPPPAAFDGYLTQHLARAHAAVQARLEAALAAEGVQVEHWKVLRVLADAHGHAMGEVAQSLLMHPPTLTKLVDKMIAQGLAMRSPDSADNRRVLLYATDQGLELSARLDALVQAHEDSLVHRLGAAKARQLRTLLSTLDETRGPAPG